MDPRGGQQPQHQWHQGGNCVAGPVAARHAAGGAGADPCHGHRQHIAASVRTPHRAARRPAAWRRARRGRGLAGGGA